jgi:hypothetical protein
MPWDLLRKSAKQTPATINRHKEHASDTQEADIKRTNKKNVD